MGEAIDQAESGRGVVFSYVVILPENDRSCIFLHSAEAEHFIRLLKKITIQLPTVNWIISKFQPFYMWY